ncbi:histone acetyltransferase p300-like isoform X3 [Micractinium conductrix]|uniref:Histone acetyltransferase p300-like isoform X3 n=1 Tax=Micractinium conductrix TaxID=554055 RepID=A0A2P6V4Y2_9CHLO|nr:histone acetyltransferase p300-like isoform X3 [Micractinium conductrix]|eukprot:PSC69150.1 histone acetyltransferase p300-like isoform X3 [Micractinium conductrix]
MSQSQEAALQRAAAADARAAAAEQRWAALGGTGDAGAGEQAAAVVRSQLEELDQRMQQLAEHERQLSQREQQLSERERHLAAVEAQTEEREQQLAAAHREADAALQAAQATQREAEAAMEEAERARQEAQAAGQEAAAACQEAERVKRTAESAQQEAQEEVRRLRERLRQAEPHVVQQHQQRQQHEEQQPRAAPPQRRQHQQQRRGAVAPAAVQPAAAGVVDLAGDGNSSEDEETISVAADVGASPPRPSPGQRETGHDAQPSQHQQKEGQRQQRPDAQQERSPQQQGQPQGAGQGGMGPPPRRAPVRSAAGGASASQPNVATNRKATKLVRSPLHSGATGAASPASQRKRQAESGADEAARRGSVGSKHRRRGEPSPSSPSGTPGAAAALRRLRQRGSSGGAGDAAEPAPSPGLGSAGNLLLSLKQAHEGEGSDGGGARRGGRRGAGRPAGGGGGGGVMRPGEGAVGWMNRAAASYLGELLKMQEFTTFACPVPRNARDCADYYSVIEHPMDLGTMETKAAQGRYMSPRELLDDFKLVVANAKEYNEKPSHPVHQAATMLQDFLAKPHGFCSKVTDRFHEAELAATLAAAAAAAEAEAEAEEERLAAAVAAGVNLAVLTEMEEDPEGVGYFVMRATRPVVTLQEDAVDGFGCEYKKGDRVVIGHYYDYIRDARNRWDRAARPYYLQDNRIAYVPASALLLVDFEMRSRKEPGASPADGQPVRVYEMKPEEHKKVRKQIRKLTADHAAPLEMAAEGEEDE